MLNRFALAHHKATPFGLIKRVCLLLIPALYTRLTRLSGYYIVLISHKAKALHTESAKGKIGIWMQG